MNFDIDAFNSSLNEYYAYRGTCKTPVANGSDMIAVAYTN